MNTCFDEDAIRAAFAPAACDGGFSDDFAGYLGDLAATRPSIVLAFAPKAAGTYLRSAAADACGGQLVRTVHAQGGRDASFYLPTWLNYFAHGFPARTLVTHVHMQALPANQAIFEVLDLKPVIMLRPISDMLASYAEMLDKQWREPDTWLNICLPDNYDQFDATQRADFLIDMVGPWYASYFSGWLEYAARDKRVLVLDFQEFLSDAPQALSQVLSHSEVDWSASAVDAALDRAWAERKTLRFNRGTSGRGTSHFTSDQLRRLGCLVDYYDVLAPYRDRLIPPQH